MTKDHFRVGIVGLQSGKSWAARAHVPVLGALANSLEIAGVAHSSLESAERAAAEIGLPRAYKDVAELMASASVAAGAWGGRANSAASAMNPPVALIQTRSVTAFGRGDLLSTRSPR